MILIAAIDDNGGMLFNHRRQSQDQAVRARILQEAAGAQLWMNAYTRKQFSEDADNITVDEACLEHCGDGEYCFIENLSALSAEPRIEKIILFKWNRHYPGDFFFDVPLEHWTLASNEDFEGSSHETITMEVYTR